MSIFVICSDCGALRFLDGVGEAKDDSGAAGSRYGLGMIVSMMQYIILVRFLYSCVEGIVPIMFERDRRSA